MAVIFGGSDEQTKQIGQTVSVVCAHHNIGFVLVHFIDSFIYL